MIAALGGCHWPPAATSAGLDAAHRPNRPLKHLIFWDGGTSPAGGFDD